MELRNSIWTTMDTKGKKLYIFWRKKEENSMHGSVCNIAQHPVVYRVKVSRKIDQSFFTCVEPTAYLCWWRSADECRPFAPHSAFWCTRLSTGWETTLSSGGHYRRRSVPPNFARLPRPERVEPDRQPAPPLPATASRRRRTGNLPGIIYY